MQAGKTGQGKIVEKILARTRGNKFVKEKLIVCARLNCYIASAETKHDWQIRGHVTLDKCNFVSLGQLVKNCCSVTNIKKQNGGETRKFRN